MDLGEAFARAFVAKDFDAVAAVLHPEVDFRGLTPRRSWEAQGSDAVVAEVLRRWLEDDDEVESLDRVETDAFSDCERVGYRFSLRNPDGRFLVEQQAYIAERDGRIGWMRVVCSGLRPVE